MKQSFATALGLFRDFVAAGLGAAVLFGVNINDKQTAGILLLVSTGGALAAYIFSNINSPKGSV